MGGYWLLVDLLLVIGYPFKAALIGQQTTNNLHLKNKIRPFLLNFREK